jgi:hypothetical protein
MLRKVIYALVAALTLCMGGDASRAFSLGQAAPAATLPSELGISSALRASRPAFVVYPVNRVKTNPTEERQTCLAN